MISYSQFKVSELYHFFNLSENTIEKISLHLKEISLKTGGFQEFIDLLIHTNNDDCIVKAKLHLAREWIGDSDSINHFSTDIAKSLIDLLFPSGKNYDPEFKKHLVHYLFNLRGNNEVVIPLHKAYQQFEDSSPEVKPFLDVFRNKQNYAQEKFNDFEISMKNLIKNDKEYLSLEMKWED